MSEAGEPVQVTHHPAQTRYEAQLGGRVVGELVYDPAPGRMSVLHTEVDPEAGGRGIGGRLAAAALDDARRDGLAVVAVCPFVRRYVADHPEYQDLLAAGH